MFRRLALAAALILAPSIARAADPEVDCANAMSTYDLNICAEQDLDRADKALNTAYEKALASIPGMASDESRYSAKKWEAALRSSQRAWVAFRDAECNGHVPMFWTGGTGTTAAVLGCMTEKTKARTEELRQDYESN